MKSLCIACNNNANDGIENKLELWLMFNVCDLAMVEKMKLKTWLCRVGMEDNNVLIIIIIVISVQFYFVLICTFIS